MINHILSECRKLAQKKDKIRHHCVSKVIWELCKKLKFYHTTKWYMHNPESVLVNVTHRPLRDFEMQTDHQISARRPDFIITNNNNKKRELMDYAVPADRRI